MSHFPQKSRINVARDNILMRLFHCKANDDLPFLDDHVSDQHRLIFLDMLDEHLVERAGQGYQITRKGIAHWRRIVKRQQKLSMLSGIFRTLLEEYDHTGAPIEAKTL